VRASFTVAWKNARAKASGTAGKSLVKQITSTEDW